MVTRVIGFEAESMAVLGAEINHWLSSRQDRHADVGPTVVDSIAFATATYGDIAPVAIWGALVTVSVCDGAVFP